MHANVTVYGLECFALLKSDVKSIDFAVTRFFMKHFRTSNIDIINDCRSSFNFLLHSEMIEIRNAKFKGRFNMCNSLKYYFGLLADNTVGHSVVTMLTLFI